MRNALNKLADTVQDPADKKVSCNRPSIDALLHPLFLDLAICQLWLPGGWRRVKFR